MYSRITCYSVSLIYVVVVFCTQNDLQKMEQEFLKSADGCCEKNLTWRTIFVDWTDDRRAALCERALNNSEQFVTKNRKEEIWPTLEEKTITFKHEKPKHPPYKATIMKCPVGTYIYESGGQKDCYYIMAEEKGSLSIDKEVCDVGIM